MTLPTGSDARGLTLIEILVSVAILAGSLALILQALARGSYALAVADNRFTSYAFLVAKLADVDTMIARGHTMTTEGQFRSGRQPFHWRLDTVPSPEDPLLEQVTLRVMWRQGERDYHSDVSLLRRLPEQTL